MSLLSNSVLGLALFAVACGSDEEFKAYPPFERTEDAKTWLTTGSALSVYSNAYEVLGVADGELTYGDPACPVTTDDGTTLTVEGGCTDTNQREWTGRATVARDGDDRTVEFLYFEGAYGTVHRRRVGPLDHEFDAVLNLGGVTHIDYEGTIAGDYDARVVFNGSGRIERDGYLRPTGLVEATTVDEVVDDSICMGQPASGSTTVTARGDSATLTYDGESDCDDERNARLSVNGEDRGLVSGIYCGVSAIGRKGKSDTSSAVLCVLLLAASGVRRRRGR
jgi:hypothetical protein